ncbi:MAG TPA: D-hexose-6-phosphate mutarotase [Alloacidobacterium sp.]|nr:D-hexose-6-phosphate mutarotase [Alloacidobacterium sp.]
MIAETLNAAFGIPGAFTLKEAAHHYVRANISTTRAEAAMYLQGAHLAQWQPAGESPVLFLGTRSAFSPGEAIRGGIPVVFPWFGARGCGLHGFARTSLWDLQSVNLKDDNLEMKLSLSPDTRARALGFDGFRLEYAVRIGQSLELELVTYNQSTQTMHFEEALHTYIAVGEIRRTSLGGLAGALYLDAADQFAEKRQAEAELRFSGHTNSLYPDTAATCVLHDEVNRRLISIEKSGSRTTVVWNPGEETIGKFPDLGADDWHRFVCVETANARGDAIALAPGATHRMAARITVEPEYGGSR